jgi:hypothetical protein
MSLQADYSAYTLPELFRARYWVDTRGKLLEREIQKRCSHIREKTQGKPLGGAGSNNRFRPHGLRFGVTFLSLFIGPFTAVKFLTAMNVIQDVNGDMAGLTGLWALLTFPVMVLIFMIGAMMDVERVVKCFNINGRHNFGKRRSPLAYRLWFPIPGNIVRDDLV